MFENTFRTLHELNGSTFSMPIQVDEDGYIDKECPNEECTQKFKVMDEDWTNLFTDDAVHCPFCGHVAPSNKWYTTEQVEFLQERAKEYLAARLSQALKSDADRFNRSQPKNSFVKLSMQYKGQTWYVPIPAPALDEMVQKITCEKCNARYAVIGSAFYCPCCGHNSARLTFANTIDKVRAKMNNLSIIEAAIPDKDEAARVISSMVESSIGDLVVALQRVCECVYPTKPGAKKLRRNAFQNLDEGNAAWNEVLQQGYEDWITISEYKELKKCFQKRHLLQHQDGIVDQDYLNKSGDTTYTIGQRIVIHKEDIIQYSAIVEQLGKKILSL